MATYCEQNEVENQMILDQSEDLEPVNHLSEILPFGEIECLETEKQKFSRTPSGNNLTDLVSEGKKLFSDKDGLLKRKREGESQFSLVNQRKVYKVQSVDVPVTQSTVKQTRSASMSEKINTVPNHDIVLKQSRSCDNINTSTSKESDKDDNAFKLSQLMRSIRDPSVEELTAIASYIGEKPVEDQSTADFPKNIKKGGKMASEDTIDTSTTTQGEEMELEENKTCNPQVIGITAVQEMFTSLQIQMDNLTRKVEDIETQKNKKMEEATVKRCTQKILSKVNEHTSSLTGSQDIEQLKNDLKYYKRRSHTLTDVVQRMSIEMEEIKARMENIEASTARRAISIKGLYLPGNKQEMIERLESFFNVRLGIQAGVEELYKMGAKEPKIIIAYLQSIHEKRSIMRNKYLLKNLKNKDSNKVYINEYFPAATQEKRRRENEIQEKVNSGPCPQEIKYSKGKMMIQGETFSPKVEPPTLKELIMLEPGELDAILKLKLNSGEKIIQDKSIFEGYTTAVSDYSQIRKLYTKMKLIQPDARHIVCAYFLPGEEATYYTQGFCDDGEPSAGRILLDFLVTNNMKNRVVFVSRKYGGIRMGRDRFDCYAKATRLVLREHPRNELLKINQNLLPEEEVNRIRTKRAEERKSKQKEKKTPTESLLKIGRGGKRPNNPLPRSTTHNNWKQSRHNDELTEEEAQGESFQHNNNWNYNRGEDWSNEGDRNFYQNIGHSANVD